MSPDTELRLIYGEWPRYATRLAEVVRPMTPQQLAIRPAPDRWPIWATVAHTASVRLHWLCGVLGEPGAEHTPFRDPVAQGWEDDLETARGADELVWALESSFAIIEHCLESWSLEQLGESFERGSGAQVQMHTRGAVLQRLFSHDAYHCGELSQTLGIHGLPQIDLWMPE